MGENEFSVNPSATAMEKSQWSSGIIMCHEDCGMCLVHMCCYPFGLASTKSTFDQSTYTMNCLCACCSPCYSAVIFRNEIRSGYGIGGSWWQDCLLGFGLCCCSACQLSREVNARGTAAVDPLLSLVEWG